MTMDYFRREVEIVLFTLVALTGTVSFGQEVGNSDIPVFKRSFSVLNFVDVNTYMMIDCSAEDYQTIEWAKDGVSYPFGWSESELLDMGVSLDSENQTLVLRKAEMCTEGNYTCIVSNQNGAIHRDLELRVKGNRWIHEPILAFDDNCGEVTTVLGDNATFTCRFFVGPNGVESVANWFYVERSHQVGEEPQNHKNGREELVWIYMKEINYTQYEPSAPWMGGKLLVVTLHILNVTEPALGAYVVMVSNGVEPAAQHRMTLSLGPQVPSAGGSRLGQLLRRRAATEMAP